jgi:hypothetical protein
MWRYFYTCADGTTFCQNTSCALPACERTAFRNGQLHPHLDGKWRFLVHDYEYGLGLFQNGDPMAAATHETNNTIHALINRTGDDWHVSGNRANVPTETGDTRMNEPRMHFNATSGTFFMRGLMTVPANRARLANMLSDLVENSHNWSVSERVYGYLSWTIEEEHIRMLGGRARGGTGTNPDNWLWDAAATPRVANSSDMMRITELPRSGRAATAYPNLPFHAAMFPGVERHGGHNHLTSFLRNRQTNIMRHIAAPYTLQTGVDGTGDGTGLGLAAASRYTVNASIANPGANQGGSVQMNGINFGLHARDAMQGTWSGTTSNDPRLRTSVVGRYWAGAPITIRTMPWPGFEVQSVTGATAISGRPNYYTVNGSSGTQTVVVTFRRVQRAEFAITAYRTNNASSYIQITNIGGVAGAPTGLWLTQGDGGSNGILNLQQFQIPSTNLAPGASMTIVCRSHTVLNQDPDWDHRTGFNLSAGERLRLTTGGATLEAGGRILQTVEIMNTPGADNLTTANIWNAAAYRRYGQNWRLDGA